MNKVSLRDFPEIISKIQEGKSSLTNIHKQHIHTFRNPNPIYSKFYEILTDDLEEQEYQSLVPNKSNIHIGQFKLLLIEIRLIEYGLYELWSEGKLSTKGIKYGECDKPIVVIAPGGAVGHHFVDLCTLLPTIKLELFDINEFSESLKDFPQIKCNKSYFTENLAEEYKKKYSDTHIVIIVSDIRSADHRSSSRETIEQEVYNDMQMQDKWFRIINPDFCIYKFRTAYNYEDFNYNNTEMLEYKGLDGELWFQSLVGSNSTELRLYAKKNCKYKIYDTNKIEKQCFYHNNVSRCNLYHHGYEGIYGLDSCYDCASIINTFTYHINLTKQKFPLVTTKFTNVIDILNQIMPKYIYKLKLIRFNGVSLVTTFAKSYICKLTKQERDNDDTNTGVKILCNDFINLIT